MSNKLTLIFEEEDLIKLFNENKIPLPKVKLNFVGVVKNPEEFVKQE